MRAILHIFAKDARRMAAPLALLALILALADGLEIQRHYRVTFYSTHPFVSELSLPLVWILVIAGVMLQDSPADARQNWLTRPISRWQLLVAKALFVFTFVNLLWFVSDCVILTGLRLPIQPLELLARQTHMTVLLFLPAMCLASVVPNAGQFALGLLMSALAFLLELALVRSEFVSLGPVHHAALWSLAALLSIVAIAWQFFRSSTAIPRALFAATVLLIPPAVARRSEAAFYSTTHRRTLFDAPETSSAGLENLKVALDLSSNRRVTLTDVTEFGLPLTVGPLPADIEVSATGAFRISTQKLTGISRSGRIYKNSAGYWLVVSGTVPPGFFALEGSLTVQLIRPVHAKTVKQGDAKVFSPAAGFVCNGGMEGFLCWHAPDFNLIQGLRATAYAPNNSETSASFLPGSLYLPMGFTPVAEEYISLSDRAKWQEVRFSLLTFLGDVHRRISATAAELEPYWGKP